MIGLTLKHLRYFDALATHRHFGRAAEACAISQPALSLQIKELEDIFGAPLVERSYRQVRLTSAGEAFHGRAADILLQVGELGNLARAVEGPLGGSLRLGVIPTVAPYLLPKMIKALAASDPDLAVQPREAVTQVLIDDLREARLDLAVVALPISEPALQEFALFDEEFVLVRPASDAGRTVPSAQLLSEMRLLLLAEGHCFRDQALSFCSLGSARPREVMEGSSLSTLVQMVGAGIGVTLIPEMAVALETRSADVCVDRFAQPRPKRTVGVVWRKSNPLATQLMRISAVVRQASPREPASFAP
jgi:LysR family hydrogen peroxide-inducible transcriptional activator